MRRSQLHVLHILYCIVIMVAQKKHVTLIKVTLQRLALELLL
jgi:hypothetical protein